MLYKSNNANIGNKYVTILVVLFDFTLFSSTALRFKKITLEFYFASISLQCSGEYFRLI